MTPSASAWLATLQQAASNANLPYLDLLIDAAGLKYPLHQRLAALPRPPDQVRLFTDTREAAVAEYGPILLRVNLTDAEQQAWLMELLQAVHDDHRLLALLSEWPLELLGKHLRHFTQASWDDGQQKGVLRFYDPWVFLGLAHNLDAQQCYQFHAAVVSWHWIDRSGAPQRLSGLPRPGNPAAAAFPVLELTNPQLANMRFWNRADALRTTRQVQPATFRLDSQEKLHEHLMRALQAAEAQGCPHDHQWALDWLADDLCITPSRAAQA